MEISTSSNIVTITGNIKTVNDFQTIKTTLDSLKLSESSIMVIVKDSLSITSSVIGYLNKLILKDKIKIEMKIGDAQLMELLNELNLATTFKARKG